MPRRSCPSARAVNVGGSPVRRYSSNGIRGASRAIDWEGARAKAPLILTGTVGVAPFSRTASTNGAPSAFHTATRRSDNDRRHQSGAIDELHHPPILTSRPTGDTLVNQDTA